MPLSVPPAIHTVGRVMLCKAYHTESTLVAFESLTYSTPPATPHGSKRCSTGENSYIDRHMLSGATPAASVASAAAMAL